MLQWTDLKNQFEKEAEQCFSWLKNENSKISSGRVNVSLYSNINVEAYGSFVPLNQLANIQVVDARQLVIKPYDKNQLKDINKTLSTLNLNATIQPSADSIRIIFAPLTEETRKQNVKKAKEIFEQSKIKLRNIRQDIQIKFKKDPTVGDDNKKYFEEELNKTTKVLNSKLEDIFNSKEKELMSF